MSSAFTQLSRLGTVRSMDEYLGRVTLSEADQRRLMEEAQEVLAAGGYLRFTTHAGTTVVLEVSPLDRDRLDA